MNYLRQLIFSGVFLLIASAIAAAEPIRVSAAISLKEAMVDIAAKYEADGGDKVELNFGSSGQLLTQIVNGAPVDLFISAAQKQIDDLVAKGHADAATRKVIAGNSLVLIVPASSTATIAKFEDLADASIKRVAMGEPRSVPAGMYAQQVMKHLKIEEALKDRIVFGSNVRQVLDYVKRGEVDAGIVYATDVVNDEEGVRIVAKADPKMHEPIEYPAVIIKASKQQESTEKFLTYLAGEKARAVLEKRGFVIQP